MDHGSGGGGVASLGDMSFSFDFGFEAPGASFDNAATVLIFESDATRETLSKTNGPAAIADASRFVELFELQIGISPFAAGLYSEVVGGANLPVTVEKRARDAADAGKVPIIISRSRTVTGLFCRTGLTALWGKLGRNECNEARLFSHRETFLAGVRAATNSAFKSVTGDVVLLTASHLMRQCSKRRWPDSPVRCICRLTSMSSPRPRQRTADPSNQGASIGTRWWIPSNRSSTR